MRRALIAVLLAGAVAVSTTKPAEARWGLGWASAPSPSARCLARRCGGQLTLITIRPTAITRRMATGTAIRPMHMGTAIRATPTATPIRPILTAATTGLTTALTPPTDRTSATG